MSRYAGYGSGRSSLSMGKRELPKSRYSFPAILAYLIVIFLPLSFLTTSGEEAYTYKIGGYIYFYELVIILLFPLAMFKLGGTAFNIRMMRLDLLIFLLLLISLVPIFMNLTHPYEEMRAYRATLLSPFVVYLVYKMCIRDKYQMMASIWAILIPVLFQTVMVNIYFLQHGARFEGGSRLLMLPVILSAYIAFALAILFFAVRAHKKRKARSFLRKALILIIIITMIMAAGRAATYGLILGVIITVFFVSKPWFQRIANHVLVIGILLFGAIVYLVPAKQLVPEARSTQEERYDVSRLVSQEQAIESMGLRMIHWKGVIEHGLTSPLIGHGLTAFDEIYRQRGSGPTHVHSLFISKFLTSGMIGFALLIIIFTTCYKMVYLVISRSKDEYLTSMAKILFIFLFLMTLIGFSNDYKGGLDPTFFLFMAMIARVYEFHRMENSN